MATYTASLYYSIASITSSYVDSGYSASLYYSINYETSSYINFANNAGINPNSSHTDGVVLVENIFKMRAYNTLTGQHIYWVVRNQPDTVGVYSGIYRGPGQFTDIQVVQWEIR